MTGDGTATCRWCLGVIEHSVGFGWLHRHEGLYLCRHPLPGAPPQATAAPLPVGGAAEHLRAIGYRWCCGCRWGPDRPPNRGPG